MKGMISILKILSEWAESNHPLSNYDTPGTSKAQMTGPSTQIYTNKAQTNSIIFFRKSLVDRTETWSSQQFYVRVLKIKKNAKPSKGI